MRTSLSYHEYQRYKATAYELLDKISLEAKKTISDLSYKDVISYFENNYPIIFNFYDFDEFGAFYPELPPLEPSIKDIKFKGLVKNQRLSYQPKFLCDNCSGMTYPDLDRNRYVVCVSQRTPVKGRVIFTILHELSHIYCHLENAKQDNIYLSLTADKMMGNYPPELLSLEQEANTVASILYLTTEKLIKSFQKRLSFEGLANENDISTPALHNRLMDFLMYEVRYSESYALKLVLDYRKGGDWLFSAPRLSELLK